MEKTDTRFHHASGKDTPLLVDTRMATFLHKKRPGLSHLSQCTERPSTVPSVPDGKIFGSGRFLLLEQCRRRIGLGNTVIGPIRIDNGVNISQNVVLIGLDHNYQDITQGIIEQGITTSPIHIGEHTIIGANVIVLPGITIGKHCFIGAGCVVTQNIPDYCVTVGNPARIIKRYNPQSQTWEKI
jgi:acetyltransferase-like isoleucine patch superfamily enzyme